MSLQANMPANINQYTTKGLIKKSKSTHAMKILKNNKNH